MAGRCTCRVISAWWWLGMEDSNNARRERWHEKTITNRSCYWGSVSRL